MAASSRTLIVRRVATEDEGDVQEHHRLPGGDLVVRPEGLPAAAARGADAPVDDPELLGVEADDRALGAELPQRARVRLGERRGAGLLRRGVTHEEGGTADGDVRDLGQRALQPESARDVRRLDRAAPVRYEAGDLGRPVAGADVQVDADRLRSDARRWRARLDDGPDDGERLARLRGRQHALRVEALDARLDAHALVGADDPPAPADRDTVLWSAHDLSSSGWRL